MKKDETKDATTESLYQDDGVTPRQRPDGSAVTKPHASDPPPVELTAKEMKAIDKEVEGKKDK